MLRCRAAANGDGSGDTITHPAFAGYIYIFVTHATRSSFKKETSSEALDDTVQFRFFFECKDSQRNKFGGLEIRATVYSYYLINNHV